MPADGVPRSRRTREPKRRPLFPTDGRYWLACWYGAFHRSADGTTQIDLVAGRLPVGRLTNWTWLGETRSPAELIEPPVTVVRMPLSAFARAPIGSVFLNGVLATAAEYIEYEPQGVSFVAGRLQYVRASLALRGVAYPLGAHPRSWCLAIRGGDDPLHVVIPCAEILRFYYGTSQALLARLLGAPFDAIALSLLGGSHVNSHGDCIVRLRPDLAMADARMVALLTALEAARRHTRSIFASLLISHRRYGVAYPKVRPPFDGPARLLLRGFWIDLDGRRRFVALKIQRGDLPPSGRRIYVAREPWNPSVGPLHFRSLQESRIADLRRFVEPGEPFGSARTRWVRRAVEHLTSFTRPRSGPRRQRRFEDDTDLELRARPPAPWLQKAVVGLVQLERGSIAANQRRALTRGTRVLERLELLRSSAHRRAPVSIRPPVPPREDDDDMMEAGLFDLIAAFKELRDARESGKSRSKLSR